MTREQLMEYKEDCGARATADLLLLCGMDGYEGDYEADMADLMIEIEETERVDSILGERYDEYTGIDEYDEYDPFGPGEEPDGIEFSEITVDGEPYETMREALKALAGPAK